MTERESIKAASNRYTKKPVTIEAFQITKELAIDHWQNDTPLPFGLSRLSGSWHAIDMVVHDAYITIETLEGRMRAELGDWIIKGIKGELYPCKPDIFAATYEPEGSTPASGAVDCKDAVWKYYDNHPAVMDYVFSASGEHEPGAIKYVRVKS